MQSNEKHIEGEILMEEILMEEIRMEKNRMRKIVMEKILMRLNSDEHNINSSIGDLYVQRIFIL